MVAGLSLLAASVGSEQLLATRSLAMMRLLLPLTSINHESIEAANECFSVLSK